MNDAQAFEFIIGARTYFVSRDDKRNGFRIISNGALVEFVSSLHYGDVSAFRRIAERLADLEELAHERGQSQSRA